MNLRQLTIIAATAAMAVLSSPTTASAHTGTDQTVATNYRTTITDDPEIDGLDVDIVDLDGVFELTWTGPGELVVTGYESEPYLRISDRGVEHNVRSPATYLNTDRYATTEPPATADPSRPPQWELISADRTVQWHDHRTHWMATTPPIQVTANPDTTHVITERWEIPLTVDGAPAVIAGDLTWTPPPSTTTITIATIALTIAVAATLFRRGWQRNAAGAAIFAVTMMTIDSIGYVRAFDDSFWNELMPFIFCAIAAATTSRLVVHARRNTPHPTLAMFATGLLLGLMGGFDRIDALSSSELLTDAPAWFARTSVIVCVAVGIALGGRFLAFLGAILARPTTAATT